MKRFLVAFLVCTAMLLAQTQAQAASKITVIVASSVDTSEQNYMNVTYKKLVELAQKYSDNAFDFQLFRVCSLATNRKPSAPPARHASDVHARHEQLRAFRAFLRLGEHAVFV